jgi:hypothetical protein
MKSFGALVVLLCSAALCAADLPRVWVEPFKETNQQPDWLTRALQQSLVDELAANGAQVSTATTKPTETRYVVTGTIQRLDGELRVSGQVIDIEGKTIGGFKATGSQQQLFAIEDSIGTQVSKAVGAEPQLAQAQQPAQPRIEAPFAPNKFRYEGSDLEDAVRRDRAIEPRPVIQYDQPLYPQYSTPMYGYGGGYYPPYYNAGLNYGWGWGFNTPSIIVVNNKGSHGHDDGHHGDGAHGSFHQPGNNTGVPANNGQAIRAVSGFGGRTPPPGVVNTITPGAPGTIHTMGAGPGVVHTRGR